MEMGFRAYAKAVAVLVIAASMVAGGRGTRDIPKATQHYWPYPPFNHRGWPFRHPNDTGVSRKIVVGGSENWRFGFNYTDWALKKGPFYLNDTLVFRYDPPNGTNTPPHSVYLLPNFWSFLNCDLSRAKRLADPARGAGEGFQVVLNKWQPYYFACGERDGLHCRVGLMKFYVMPFLRWRF